MLLCVASMLVMLRCVPAQQPMPAGQQSQDQTSQRISSGVGSSAMSMRDSLTALQIEDIVQQRPELITELKSLLADQLQQQGINVLADSISDEQFFQQIALSASLRAVVTEWLRARGYVSQADLQRSSLEARDEDGLVRTPSNPDLDQLTPQFGAGRPVSSSGLNAEPASLDPLSSGERSSRTNGLSGDPNRETIQRQTELRDGLPSRTQTKKPEQNVTDVPEGIHRPTPYNLLSLRDLYTQVPQDSAKLKRFGSEAFLRRDVVSRNSTETSSRDATDISNGASVVDRLSGVGGGASAGNGSMGLSSGAIVDVPIGPDYILGAGDSIVVNIWGGVSQTLNRTVDREGKIVLPEAGSLVVAGLSLDRAQQLIEGTLQQQFRNAHVDVTIARLRTVRIYVVGDVQRPGAYDISSLSTPLNALYSAGGPTGIGSLRIVRHCRGDRLIREVDLYDFLLHGVRSGDERLVSGDTLLVPPAGAEVAVFGSVRRPAIYELKGEETLATLLEDAGGATVAAALNHITIDRIQPNRHRETVTLAANPGDSDASITARIASFKVKDGDRIHVSPILPYSERAIYVEGHFIRPGKHAYRDGMQLADILHSYQDLLPEPSAHGEVVRLVAPDLHVETIQFSLADLLIGNTNLPLQPFDTIRVYGRYEVDSPQVIIRGEVLRPGAYSLSQGMTAAGLVRMAGGFKRDALLESADLTSYSVTNGSKVVSERSSIAIGTAIAGHDSHADVSLKPGDILTIHQISGWSDIGASIKVNGEVTYPGSYGLQEGERLSSVLRRAGGLRGTAYPDGAILIRLQVKQLEEKSREELIRQIETTSVSARLAPSLSGQDETALLQAASQQQTEVLQRLRNQPVSGRLVIHINPDFQSWENTSADIELRSGDILTIPKRPSFVLVSGQVYNSSAITFAPGRTANWYLQQAGGANGVANKGEIFIVRADGSVVGKHSGGMFASGVLSTRLDPGDVIVVPQKIIGGSMVWRNLLTVAQITSSLAITAAVAGVL
jgi:protein involved in polysaccharide export with SLBB domain